MPDQTPFRCTSCFRLLLTAAPGAIAGAVTVKCPRCRAINTFGPAHPFEPTERPARQPAAGTPDEQHPNEQPVEPPFNAG